MNTIYGKLAPIYDDVMHDVDYEEWADFIDDIIQTHRPEAVSVLELACGTGTLALLLDELDTYDITATDVSGKMLDVARRKSKSYHADVTWEEVDFLDITLNKKFDVALLLFDSLNYIHETEKIRQLLDQVRGALKDDGVFIFDFTTPKYSATIESMLNEDRVTENHYRYIRKSFYDPENRLHRNDFTIQKLSEDHRTVLSEEYESHTQKIYSPDEIQDIISRSEFSILAAYKDFTMEKAGPDSGRITMVLSCQQIQ